MIKAGVMPAFFYCCTAILFPDRVRRANWVAKMCPRCQNNLFREKFLQKTATETAPLQFYSFANKSFFFDGLQHLGEGFKEVAGAFDGVVEDDDGAGLKVGDYVAGAGVAVDVAVVVPADDVPHYVVVSFVKDPCLVGTYAGIWGAEEV